MRKVPEVILIFPDSFPNEAFNRMSGFSFPPIKVAKPYLSQNKKKKKKHNTVRRRKRRGRDSGL